jgi:hypothetical protein
MKAKVFEAMNGTVQAPLVPGTKPRAVSLETALNQFLADEVKGEVRFITQSVCAMAGSQGSAIR